MQGLENLQIIYEDNHLIAVNKLPGVLVQGDKTGDIPVGDYVKLYIKSRYHKPGDVFLGQIHRIDRPVSGVVLFARTSKGLTRMNKMFQDRKVDKTYWAVVGKRPQPITGQLRHFLLKNKSRNITKAYEQIGKRTAAAKEAILNYELLAEFEGYYLLQIKPETGRPHQIRVQLAQIQCSIVGDLKYGYGAGNGDGSIHLHSRSLSFIHPVKKIEVLIQADPPEDPIWSGFMNILTGNKDV